MDVDVVDGVTVLRMNHPPVNAMDLEFVDTAVATIRDVDGPIVLIGTGKCFSAGVDLPAIVEGGDEYIGRFMTSATAAFFAVFDHPAPVVAAINGHAIAGGCVLAMASDVRIMSTGLIGLSELVVGVPFPVVGLEICRYAMGRSAARAVLQAQSIDAPAAMTRGWIDEIVSPDDLLPRAIETARAMGQFAPAAFAAMKSNCTTRSTR
jgi:enoyl-CoA hydratase